MKQLILTAAISLAAASSFAAVPATFLAPDNAGRPVIQISATSGSYYLYRAADAYDGGCGSNYSQVMDSNGKNWCRSIATFAAGINGVTITDSLPFDAISENSPAEFEYKVGASTDVNGVNGATYIGWAPSIAVSDPNPLATWVQKINTQYGVGIATNVVPATSFSTGDTKKISVVYGGNSHIWTFYYNNKYVAIFNEYGGLLGLTHRTYGIEFINSYNLAADKAYPCLINNSPDTFAGPVTIDIRPNGNLIVQGAYNRGYNFKIVWNLKSNSDSTSSSGLNGKIEVKTSGAIINNVSFPYVYGLGYSNNRELTVPKYNGGRRYLTTTTYSDKTTLITYGQYPSGNWQAQFFSIRDNLYSFYVATEDAAQLSKDFHVKSVSVNNGVYVAGAADIWQLPINGSANLAANYSTVMTPMPGSWERSAKKYQFWASKQNWNQDGLSVLPKITSRPISQRVKEGRFWWTSFYSGGDLNRPTPFLNHSNIQKSLIGTSSPDGAIRAGFHLYNWWNKAFDTNYPQFIANADTVAQPKTWQQQITSVQADDSLIAPYINASATDISNAPIDSSGFLTTDGAALNSTGSNARNADHCPQDIAGNGWWDKNFPNASGVNLTNAMLIGSDGKPFVACFGKRLFGIMDPASSIWQSIIDSNSNAVFDLTSGGIYLDSFAAADTRRTSSASQSISGHLAGYGDWYRTGTRQIASKVAQNALSKEQSSPVYSETGIRRFIASEFFNEATIPYIDLIMNYVDTNSADLPVLQGVYNQFQMIAGQRPRSTQSDLVKKAVLGRSFVWGYQLGLVETYDICPGSDCSSASSQNVLAYAKTLARAREAAQQNSVGLDWNVAKLIGTADDRANEVNYSNGDDWCSTSNPDTACPAALSAVRGSFWSSAGTNAADYLVLTNTTNNSQVSTISTPRAWASVSLVYQSATGATSALAMSNNVLTVPIAGNAVLIYKVASYK